MVFCDIVSQVFCYLFRDDESCTEKPNDDEPTCDEISRNETDVLLDDIMSYEKGSDIETNDVVRKSDLQQLTDELMQDEAFCVAYVAAKADLDASIAADLIV